MPVSMHAALYKTILHTLLLLLLVLAQIYMHDPEKQGGYRCYRIYNCHHITYVCTWVQALPNTLPSNCCNSKRCTTSLVGDIHYRTSISRWYQGESNADPFHCDYRTGGLEGRDSRWHGPHKRTMLQAARRERKKESSASYKKKIQLKGTYPESRSESKLPRNRFVGVLIHSTALQNIAWVGLGVPLLPTLVCK